MGFARNLFLGTWDDDTARDPAQQAMQRTTVWGFMTGQHGDSQVSTPRRGMSEREIEMAATAYHEAGHGRAARRGGFDVGGMWANAEGSGLTQISDDVDTSRRGGKRSLLAMLVAGIAGQEAEIRYLMDYHGYSRRDAEHRTHHGASGDREMFGKIAEGTGYTWEQLRDEARRLVKWNWYTIETNAKPLAQRGHRKGTWA